MGATLRAANATDSYTLSDRASDREAAALAQKENKADIVSGLDLTDQDPIVSEILIDLALRDATNRSIGERAMNTIATLCTTSLSLSSQVFMSEVHISQGFLRLGPNM